MNNVIMEVSSPEELVLAICFARNAFLENTKICVDNSKKTFNTNISSEIQTAITGLYSLDSGYFSMAQTKSYTSEISFDALGTYAKLYLTTKYMSSEKECNDFTCIASEISEILLKECGRNASTIKKIKNFSAWVNNNFDYKNTNSYKDHSAVELLKNRTGVCQAIAALAVKVLPYMGIETQYVSGQGYGTSGWGNHAWNIVKINGRWIHVDFTFALNSIIIPMTDTSIHSKQFERTHQWNKELLCNRAIEARAFLYGETKNSEIVLIENENYFLLQNVKIHTRFPVYTKQRDKDYIAIKEFINFLDGACELNPSTDTMRICVGSRIITLQNASILLNPETGAIDREILGSYGIKNVKYKNKLMLTFSKTAA